MRLELTDEQTKALIRELSLIIEYDPHGLGRLVDVHIMARWKWATGPTTVCRRSSWVSAPRSLVMWVSWHREHWRDRWGYWHWGECVPNW